MPALTEGRDAGVPRAPLGHGHEGLRRLLEVGERGVRTLEHQGIELRADKVGEEPIPAPSESGPLRDGQSFLPSGNRLACLPELRPKHIANENHRGPPFPATAPVAAALRRAIRGNRLADASGSLRPAGYSGSCERDWPGRTCASPGQGAR